VHNGARLYYDDEEVDYFELLATWIYVLPILLGGLGTLIVMLRRRLRPKEHRGAGEIYSDLATIAARLKLGERDADMVTQLNALLDTVQIEVKAGDITLDEALCLRKKAKRLEKNWFKHHAFQAPKREGQGQIHLVGRHL
jgi:hypothetical protein